MFGHSVADISESLSIDSPVHNPNDSIPLYILQQKFILIFFSMWPFLVMCGTMDYLFHVWGGVGVGRFFMISICTELLCLGEELE